MDTKPIGHAASRFGAHRYECIERPEHCGRIALVLQGGGALGAYQGGVYEALSEAGIEPDWVSGVSIGAINAAIGANCGAGLDATERAITALRDAFPDMPLVAKSNLGMPTLHDGRAVYAVSPADFAAHAQRVHKLGAAIVGGCCGSTPQHLRAAALALQPKDTTRSLHAVPRQNQS